MNKKTLMVMLVVGVLVLGGAGFGYYTMKMNADTFRGIPVPVKGVSVEYPERWTKAFEKALKDDAVLGEIVTQSGYAQKMEVADGEAVAHLKEAIRVQFKKDQEMIVVGLRGKRRYRDDLDQVAGLLFQRGSEEVVKKDRSYEQYLDMLNKARQGSE